MKFKVSVLRFAVVCILMYDCIGIKDLSVDDNRTNKQGKWKMGRKKTIFRSGKEKKLA
jgi:hypothetical protein